jgi:hypothetical protein
VLGSKLGSDTGYPEGFRGFPLFLQANVGIVPRSGHEHFLPNPLPIHHWILYNQADERVAK